MKLTSFKATPLVLLLLVAAALASVNTPYAEKTVLSATPERTVMTMTFDENSVLDNIGRAVTAHDLTYGDALLAIAPMGNPVARVLAVEYSNARVTTPLDDSEIPLESQLVFADSPVIMHGLRLSAVSVTPVVRTADGVRAVSRVDFEVETCCGGGINPLLNPRPIHWAFEPLFREMVDNLDEINPLVALDAPARFLVLASTAGYAQDLSNLAQFQTWLDLKRRKGFTIQIATLSDVFAAVGDSGDAGIRHFVTNTYDDPGLPPLVYACVIGDFDGGGTFPRGFRSLSMRNPEYTDDSKYGDSYYFCTDGNDYIPDVFYGRIAAQTQTQFAAYFNKAVQYETNPYLDNRNWFESVTFTAGNFSDNGTYPVTPVWNMNWAREYVMNAGCITDADTFYFHDQTEDPLEWTEEIIQDVNAGVCGLWYRGWADQQGWQCPSLRAAHVMTLQTGRRHPAVFGIVCGSGDFAFASGPCLGEVFTTILGTVPNPNGAIVFVGATDLHTNTRHNNAILAKMLESMIVHDIRSTGALLAAGKLEVYRQFPLERDSAGFVHYYAYHIYNTLGDPEVPLYFCQPKDFNVSGLVDVMPNGANFMSFLVNDLATGGPVPGAVVAVRAGSSGTSATAVTDQTGTAVVPVNFGAESTGQVTVWKHGFFLRQHTFDVVDEGNSPFISEVIWDAGADGLPNPGETVNLSFNVTNRGTESATWNINLVCDAPEVTIVNGNATLPQIAPGASATSSSVTLQISSQAQGSARPLMGVWFNNGISNAPRDYYFDIAAPEPQIVDFIVHDTDGILSPGETADVSVVARNLGDVGAANLSATVFSFDNAISFTDNSVTWDNFALGTDNTSTTRFTASVPAGVTPGRQIALRLGFNWNGADFASAARHFVAGQVTPNVPSGPDEYGYYAYEDTDLGYSATPTYSWQELDPDFGGSGGEAHVVNDDTFFDLDLPQPFTFYGETYTHAYICSNGWLSFGTATIPEFRNWEIPSPIGPPAMICPYWEDLISPADTEYPNDYLDFNMYTRAEANRFIVQWRTLNNGGMVNGQINDDYCVFQLVLEFDNLGDDDILCLYNQIHDAGASTNYSTVGIQNDDHLIGLGLSYAETYVPSASPLAAGKAIRFTTTPPDGFLGTEEPTTLPTQFALHAAYPNPFNPATELRFDLTQNAHTTLKVYDIVGREVATLIDGNLSAGTHQATFDASNLASGLYFARLQSGQHSAVQKLVLMK